APADGLRHRRPCRHDPRGRGPPRTLRRRRHRGGQAPAADPPAPERLRPQGRQQLAIIQRLVADLDLPVRIEPVEIQREPSGLARSSRNAYLGPAGRRKALALSRTIARAMEAAPSAGAIRAVLE